MVDIALERSYPTPLANSTLLPLLVMSLIKQKNAPDTKSEARKEYDFIVVGGGSAGAVVASRLSEIPCVNVLLLEAGKSPPVLTDVTAFSRAYWFSDIDWTYKTTPQKHTGRLQINRQIVYPAGKVLGGSSILNAMAYVRGNRRDYDDWEANGAKGWSFKDVFPYFLKLEDNNDEYFLDNGYHTVGGPVTVERSRYVSEFKQPALDAAVLLGHKIGDPNGVRQGVTYDLEANIRDNQRCSTAKAYLAPVDNRTNLDIVLNARVKKVVIKQNRATGVIYDLAGSSHYVRAKQEVIVSAGGVNSPQLLMLSGIGPKRHLRKFKIPVQADLPVGQNFHDHCGTALNYELDSDIQLFSKKLEDTQNVENYIYNRTGPLSCLDGTSVQVFAGGEFPYSTIDLPAYQLYFVETEAQYLGSQINLNEEAFKQIYGPYENKPMFFCQVVPLRPKSRGQVQLQSTDPFDAPLIDPNFLADPEDVKVMVEGMRTCHGIATAEPMQKVAKPFTTSYPGCERYEKDTDPYFECQLKAAAFTIHHPVGTVKMGDPKDPTTVVDPELRVKGIKGLRVVDASIMPSIPSGNTNIPAIMVGEKASDIIKKTIVCK